MSAQFFEEAKSLHKYIAKQLANLYDMQEANNISRTLLLDLLHLRASDLLINKSLQLTKPETEKIQDAIKRLMENEPVQYITGKCHFHGFEFFVNKHVLIPRPETEELVNLIVSGCGKSKKMLDIGTGSGCIAISLFRLVPDAQVDAIDVDRRALEVARHNAEALNAQVNFIEVDILEQQQLDETYDVIVSNPPYVLHSDAEKMSLNVLQFEPHKALFVPNDQPLLFYDKIAQLASQFLSQDGLLFFEIHEKFGPEIAEMLSSYGFQKTHILKDLQGKDRMVRASRR